MMGGILGSPDGVPESSPELQRLYFDVIERVVNPEAANGSRLVYQWRFTDAEPWHLVIDNGSTHAEPGEAPNPNLVLEASWADFVATGKPDANPLKMVLHPPPPPPRLHPRAGADAEGVPELRGSGDPQAPPARRRVEAARGRFWRCSTLGSPQIRL